MDDPEGDEPLASALTLALVEEPLGPDDEALADEPDPPPAATIEVLRFLPALAVGASSSARECKRECRCSVSLRKRERAGGIPLLSTLDSWGPSRPIRNTRPYSLSRKSFATTVTDIRAVERVCAREKEVVPAESGV